MVWTFLNRGDSSVCFCVPAVQSSYWALGAFPSEPLPVSIFFWLLWSAEQHGSRSLWLFSTLHLLFFLGVHWNVWRKSPFVVCSVLTVTAGVVVCSVCLVSYIESSLSNCKFNTTWNMQMQKRSLCKEPTAVMAVEQQAAFSYILLLPHFFFFQTFAINPIVA